MESYLQTDISAHLKTALTQIRRSAHSLEIERGRKAKPRKIPGNEWDCRHGKILVEDEIHIMTQCPLHNQLRVEMLSLCPKAVSTPTNKELFRTLLTTDDPSTLKQVGIYIM